MNAHETQAWRLYQAGREYNRRIGLYETVRQNERFYRGDQWYGASGSGEAELPRPVFNLIRRVTDYLVSSVATGRVTFSYGTDAISSGNRKTDGARAQALQVLTDEAEALWENTRMERKLGALLSEVALAGDGAFFCRWDPDEPGQGPYRGNIETNLIHGSDLFVADVSRADIQSQDWVMLAGRERVDRLHRDAEAAGIPASERQRIRPDRTDNPETGIPGAGVYAASDGESLLPDGDLCTVLTRFYRDPDGYVVYRRSTKGVDFPPVKTHQKLYPIAFLCWYPTRDSYHGTSPITGMLPNQKYLNLAYALAMKHMRDTAFSKVIYDQSRIPEWTNEAGQAIAAVGGGDIGDAACVIGVGKMQDQYLELLRQVEEVTKEMMGATDSVLGSETASNTSAILALQEATRVSLGTITVSYGRFLEEVAEIWRDLICSCFPPERPVPNPRRLGESEYADFSVLSGLPVRASAEVTGSGRYSASETLNVLDRLLSGGHISVVQYLERLPDGLLCGRETLIGELKNPSDPGAEGGAVHADDRDRN